MEGGREGGREGVAGGGGGAGSHSIHTSRSETLSRGKNSPVDQ